MKKSLLTSAALLVMLGLALTSCSKKQEAAPESKAAEENTAFAWVEDMGDGNIPAVNPLLVEGDVITAGSSTLAPLAAVVVEMYRKDGFKGQITIDVIGSGAGFERWAKNGETDVSNASRKIKDSEVKNAHAIGREPIQFRVGTDALAVAVSVENTFLDNATAEELAQIFGPAETWADIKPQWPNEAIQRFIPGTDSGTFDFFVEMVYHKDPGVILSASNTQASEDDNILARGVSGSPYAIGFFGYAYYAENKDKLKLLSIEGILPSQTTVDKATYDSMEKNAEIGGYPIARPMFIYSDKKIMRNRPQVAAYVAYFINNVNHVINEVGYFPANLNEAKQNWLTAMSGTW